MSERDEPSTMNGAGTRAPGEALGHAVEPDPAGRVTCERVGHVASILLDRPRERHALTSRMLIELADHLTTVEADPEVRAVMLSSTGLETFTVGGDLGSLLPLFTGARAPADSWDERLLADLSVMGKALMIDDFKKPVIAAVTGDAIGGGFELMLACDLRVVSNGGRYGLPEVRRGVVPGAGSMVRLPRQIPWAQAMELLLLGELVNADWLRDAGLVNRVVEPGAVFDVAMSLANALADNAPLSVQGCKEVALRSADVSWNRAFAIEREISARVMMSEDAREGPRAFQERRPPRFTGR